MTFNFTPSWKRVVGLWLVLLLQTPLLAQSRASALAITQNPPPDLLAKRSVILYDFAYAQKELVEVQRSFQKTGIDPIAYFDSDVVFAGKDISRAFAEYFVSREVSYLILLEKSSDGFRMTTTAFDQKPGLFTGGQPAWGVSNQRLEDLLLSVWRDSWLSQKKKNFLISDFPETDIAIDPIRGNRQEFYAIDLKVDNLAVPKFGDAAMDAALEQFFIDNYPLKYKIVEANADEKELRMQGYLYVLCYVHTRGSAAKEILGYDMSKEEKNYASITFPAGQLQLKIIPREKEVFKFYFRHIDNGNAFLGTKWDADSNWLDALRNHVGGFKHEAKIN